MYKYNKRLSSFYSRSIYVVGE